MILFFCRFINIIQKKLSTEKWIMHTKMWITSSFHTIYSIKSRSYPHFYAHMHRLKYFMLILSAIDKYANLVDPIDIL